MNDKQKIMEFAKKIKVVAKDTDDTWKDKAVYFDE